MAERLISADSHVKLEHDQVKARLPVWKHQRFADGSDEWVNCP